MALLDPSAELARVQISPSADSLLDNTVPTNSPIDSTPALSVECSSGETGLGNPPSDIPVTSNSPVTVTRDHLANDVNGDPSINDPPAVATSPRSLALQTATNTFLNTVLSAPDAPSFDFSVPFLPSRDDGLGYVLSEPQPDSRR
ncbi:hypothetical protein PCANC_28030 [Puccinia coronata f. sp. avenae]|uniref:Uncharacterized protein n=1 Tax=Puccinia coronata f. sp. avenae TaxID=200324 RepID=A0A2N5TI75_9BASI|nr:hypothetical protein PCANC_28030 [Puccinia coronata f. sp. avenae]